MQCASIERLTGTSLVVVSHENVHASHAGAIVEENLDGVALIFLSVLPLCRDTLESLLLVHIDELTFEWIVWRGERHQCSRVNHGTSCRKTILFVKESNRNRKRKKCPYKDLVYVSRARWKLHDETKGLFCTRETTSGC